jgi:hypothetical protein
VSRASAGSTCVVDFSGNRLCPLNGTETNVRYCAATTVLLHLFCRKCQSVPEQQFHVIAERIGVPLF